MKCSERSGPLAANLRDSSKFSWPRGIVLPAMLALAAITLHTNIANAAGGQIQMVAGQQRVISAPGVTRIAIGNPNVADVKVVGTSEVLVAATGDGATELTIWRGSRIAKYSIIVSTKDPRQLRREVEKFLGDREGIRVRQVRDQVHIEGKVLTLADLEKAEEIASMYPQVRNMVRLDPSARSHIATALNRQLQRAGLPNAQASVVGRTIFLEGMVDTEADLKKAELIIGGMGNNIHNVITLGSSRLIEIDVEFVEVSKNSLDQIGIKWPTNITGAIAMDFSDNKIFRGIGVEESSLASGMQFNASFGLALQFNDGHSRTLAHPRLVAGNNQEAKFLAGGEIPIPIVTNDRVYVEFKEYGIRLNVTPHADGNGTIRAKILSEVSQIDQSVAVNGIPGFLTRRIDTHVTVHDGETIVLSGLVQVTEGKDVTKVPFLGHIPIIGELFKSRQFRERRTELVVFVTPRLVDPLSKHLRSLVRDMKRTYIDAEGTVEFGLFD